MTRPSRICAVLDHSPYGNVFDPRSNALIAGALEAAGWRADLLSLSRATAEQVRADLAWLRFDIRSRKDLLLVLELARLLESRGIRVFPSPSVIWAAEDKWETFLRLRKAGIRIPPTFRGRDHALCPYPAIFKPRVGWGGLGNKIIQCHEDLAGHDIPTPATLPDGTQIEGVMLRSPLKGDDYLCQAFYEHPRTLIACLANDVPICGIDDRADSGFEEGRGPVVPLSDEVLGLARASMKAVGLIAGTVDLIETPEEILVLEVNSAPRLTYPHLPEVDLATPMVKAVLDTVMGPLPRLS